MAGAFRIATLLAVLSPFIVGCAALRGSPEAVLDVTQEMKVYDVYLSTDVLARATSANPADRNNMGITEWRDAVIAVRLQITDQNFRTFANRLRMDVVGLNLGTDLAALGLTAASGLAAGATAKALAVASTASIGAGAAFNKEALYQQTLPAVIAQMEANRAQVLIRIRTGQSNSDAAKYPLSIALSDLAAYERAGSIEDAAATLTKQASQQVQANQIVLDRITLGTANVSARYEVLRAFIQKLIENRDTATLSSLAKALQITIAAGASTGDYNKAIFNFLYPYVYNRLTEAEKLAALDELQKTLKPFVTF